MSFFEIMCVAKLIAVFFDYSPKAILSKLELNVASEAIKKVANQSDFPPQFKEKYNQLIDFLRETTPIKSDSLTIKKDNNGNIYYEENKI